MDLSALFARPLIIGASVSADWLAPSPGKILSQRLNPDPDIRRVAFNGRPAQDLVPSLSADDWRDRSVVIGIDLFFWDSALRQSRGSLKAMDDLFAKCEQLNIPALVGLVPELFPTRQPQLETLNAALRAHVPAGSKHRLITYDQVYRELVENGELVRDGRTYTVLDLLPDGLHLSRTASEILSDLILSIVTSPS